MTKLLAAAVVIVTALPAPAPAQLSAFRYEPARVRPGAVLHYAKSNFDGTHASEIAVYVAAADRLESFKWNPGSATATLVTAELDWSRFSVRRFESWRLAAGERTLVAELTALPGGSRYVLSLGPARDTVRLERWPWHSYDFDLASLGATFSHLIEPSRPFTVWIADPAPGERGATFLDKGPVTVAPVDEEVRNGVPARRYRIDGPGLEHRGGHLWVARDGGHLLGYEIDLPDEPGMTSGKLALTRTGTLSPAEWEAFQRRSLGGR